MKKLVTTQTELDQAIADGVTDLIIDAPGGAYLEIRHDGLLRLWGSSRAVLRESSRAELWESSRAVLWESSSAVLRESSSAELRGSSRAELWESSSAVLRGSSRAELGRWTVVHVWSQQVTVSGDGHVIDMTAVDLADVDTWRAYTGADRPADASCDHLIVGHVSSQDHPGRLDRDGKITIGCFRGDVTKLRELIAGDQWPSAAGAQSRAHYRPRLLAFADLCEAQLAAWAEAQK